MTKLPSRSATVRPSGRRPAALVVALLGCLGAGTAEAQWSSEAPMCLLEGTFTEAAWSSLPTAGPLSPGALVAPALPGSGVLLAPPPADVALVPDAAAKRKLKPILSLIY